ncbi:hypothetical protein NPIL_157171 [Nephila pilipes]|uniref:Uncharacterized protein n=1 Tax=Nephila pilipes TaxID=299642 RepID=A0A8X6NSH8_NEPPI|nr:hypothetical protein NPIL_157171 [Nephila pilipes]
MRVLCGTTSKPLRLSRVSALSRGMASYKHIFTVSVWLLMRSVRSVVPPIWTAINCGTVRTRTITCGSNYILAVEMLGVEWLIN